MNNELRILWISVGVVFASLSPIAWAQKKPAASSNEALAVIAPADIEACSALLSQIDVNLKRIAAELADGELDDSAPRETNRLLRQIGYRQSNQIALMQLTNLRCNPPSAPLRDSEYLKAAEACAPRKVSLAATMRGFKLADENFQQIPECDRSKWIKSPVNKSNG